MTPFEVSKAINARFVALWPSACASASAKSVAIGGPAIPLVPYTVDNLTAPEGNATFARLRIISLSEDQRTIGPRATSSKSARRSWENTGIIEVRISGPKNVGRGGGDLLAGEVRRMFRGVRFGNTVGRQGVITEATEINEDTTSPEATTRWILICSTAFSYVDQG